MLGAALTVGVVSRLLPQRNVTLLRAESLINDGTALVVYSMAVGVSSPTRTNKEPLSRYMAAAGTASDPGSGPLLRRRRQEADLRLALLEHKRSAVIGLRDQHRIDDAVLLRVQEQLDAEEVRLEQVRETG
ncbi:MULTISPECIES: hypothetical protein [unclassified Streptomyces]|uniref:hypothetical protein n=1 Tax=unclassified Streptomyces TaxID=2593676 RepID=UPI00093B82BB|nr:hypothetical protein [Streptomyces sp. CB02058]OKI92298.1 hypothetical protein AMK10_21220 [Streptomyces sp. CB02058]